MDTVLPHVHLRPLFNCLKILPYLNFAHEYSSAIFCYDGSDSLPLKACHSCVLPTDVPSPAQPISPPRKAAGEYYYSCYVDYQNRMHEIQWTNSGQYPNLSNFPEFDGTANKVALSKPMAKAFAASTLLDYGTDGCIRCSHVEPLPIIKLAHPNRLSRLRIRHEFAMLKEMKLCSLPVPIFCTEPLTDDDGIFGYRMERLSPINLSDSKAVSRDMRTIVKRLHDCGLSHGDLNPSNVMRNGNGNLVLIDPSLSGRIGEHIPDHIPWPQYESTLFCTTTDENYLKMFFGCDLDRAEGMK